jgi:5'-nucleotidase
LKIILTNDDGIDAPGLKTLESCFQDGVQTVIVAPAQPQSGVGHRVTTRSPIRVNQTGPNRFSVEGTPVAGINRGANLGSDVYNSGTVAAAREAAILGCRSIAISQYVARDRQVDWSITGYHAEVTLKMLMERYIAASHFWNVNLPHPLVDHFEIPVEFCGLDTNPHKYDFRKNENEYFYDGSIHERPRDPGTDVAVCFDEGKVSITRIAVGTTNQDGPPPF